MASSGSNLLVISIVADGQQLSWLCLSLCTIDTLVNASTLFAVSFSGALVTEWSPDLSSLGHAGHSGGGSLNPTTVSNASGSSCLRSRPQRQRETNTFGSSRRFPPPYTCYVNTKRPIVVAPPSKRGRRKVLQSGRGKGGQRS